MDTPFRDVFKAVALEIMCGQRQKQEENIGEESVLMINLNFLALNIIINIIVISPFLWISGRALVGKEKARFSDAVLTVILGTVIGVLFGIFFHGFMASIIQLILWLALIRHFFECGWLQALAISLLAVVIFAFVAIALGLIGFTLIAYL